jgi:two-component system, NarL family, response regulator NreC
MTAKVLLAEDLTLLRSGVRALLESTGKVQIVGEAADGREALKLAQKLTPDVVLMDVAMPEMNGIEAARQIRKALPQVRVMMLSMHADRQYIFESLRAGASGYVLKNAAPTELLSAIQTVVTGGTFLSSSLADLVMDDYLRRARGQHAETEMEKLSAREREVLQLLAEGNSSSEIARRLHISTRTVDTHRQHIMEKLDIHSIAGLTRFAIRHGLSSL